MMSIAETGLCDGQPPGYDGAATLVAEASGSPDPLSALRSVPRPAGGIWP
jgi:hypothetical protein